MLNKIQNHSTTILIATFCIFLFGLQAYKTLPRESAPDIAIPVVVISTPYVGVSPADVEALVSIPLERELAALRDVKRMTSTSAEGVSVVSIEFEPDVEMSEALQGVRDKVSRAKPNLPDDAEEPEVREVSFSDVPMMIVTLSGTDEETLEELGEELQDEVGRVNGVLDAGLTGGLTREIRVQVDPFRLAHYGISLSDVIVGIQGENVNIPGGEVRVGDGSFLVRVPGEFVEPNEIEGVPLRRVGERPVLVSDVARVVDGYQERSTYSRMNTEPSVSLSVTKRTGSNIIGVADLVREIVADQSESWPEGVTYRILADESNIIRDMVSELQNNILTALILVVGVILTFLGARTSLFVAVAIPLSMLMSFTIIQAFGFTLNMVVLFSLILALGMLVDNAIVVVENIYRHMEEGKTAKQAAIDATAEVGWAVTASTATTVAAFFPLVFWTGIMGEFMGYLPKTLIIVLTASLLVALFILPVLTAKLMRTPKVTVVHSSDGVRSVGKWLSAYRSVLEWSIDHRYRSAFMGLAALIITFMAYGKLNHGTEFFASTEPDRATISVRAPDGSDIESTDAIMRRVEVILEQEENVEVFVSESGVSGGGDPLAGSQASPNQGRITIDFLPHANAVGEGETPRVENTHATIARIRSGVSQIVGAEVTIEQQEVGPPVGAAIGVEISGDDFHAVGTLARAFKREIEAIPGAVDLADDYRVGRPELRLQIDRAAAETVGVSSGEIGNAIRTAVAGTVASTLRDGEDEHDILVELAPEYREDLQSVLNLRIPGRNPQKPGVFPVPLSSVAGYELAGGTGSINHIDQDLVVSIVGDVEAGFNANSVREEIQKAIDAYPVPEGLHISIGGADDEQRNAQAFLSRAFTIAIVLILMVLVTQFNSLAIPVLILATVVLSLIGVLWGLIITGTPFGIIMTGIGVISLAGVVVNNAIVLLDYVEQLQREGLETRSALVEAGLVRFRPVMLTAVTTILGLVPMAAGISFDFSRMRLAIGGASAQWWGPMAVAVIFGLGFATILTLVMVPTFYSILTDVRGLMTKITGRVRKLNSTVAILLVSLFMGWSSSEAKAVGLEEIQAAAVENSHEMALATEARVQTDELVNQAISTVLPRLSAHTNYTINQYEMVMDPSAGIPEQYADMLDSEPIIIQAQRYLSAGLTVTQTIYDPRTMPAWRATQALASAASRDELTAEIRVGAAAVKLAYMVQEAREGVALSHRSLEIAQGQLGMAERGFEAGSLTARDTVQARLGVSRSEREVRATEDITSQLERSLAIMTGLDRDVELDLPESLEIPLTLADAQAAAIAQRGDYGSAQARSQAAFQEAKTSRWTPLPSISATWIGSWTENLGFSDEPLTWMAVFEAKWNLFDGGYTTATHRSDMSRWRASQALVEQIEDSVSDEVEAAFRSVELNQLALDSIDNEVELAGESLRLAEQSLAAGSLSWLEVELARHGWEAAVFAQLRARTALVVSKVELIVATGGQLQR